MRTALWRGKLGFGLFNPLSQMSIHLYMMIHLWVNNYASKTCTSFLNMKRQMQTWILLEFLVVQLFTHKKCLTLTYTVSSYKNISGFQTFLCGRFLLPNKNTKNHDTQSKYTSKQGLRVFKQKYTFKEGLRVLEPHTPRQPLPFLLGSRDVF